MNAIAQQLKPFTPLLGHEAVPKKDFLKMVHQFALSGQRRLVNLLEMIQFTKVRKEGEEIIFE